MKYLRLLVVTWMLSGLAACGSAAAPTPNDILDTVLPPGTSQKVVLVEPQSGEDAAAIATDAGGRLLGEVPGTGYYTIEAPQGVTVSAFRHQLAMDPRVRSAEHDRGMSSPEGDGSTLPAGGLLLGSAIASQTELVRIGADAARTRATGMAVRVAVLDTGMLPHEVTDANVDADGWDFVGHDADPLDEPDFQDGDGDGLIDEGHAHGLFVASLILAVAPDARIVPFRVLDSDGTGRVSMLAAAIDMAADRGVDVINLSVSMEDSPQVLRDAVQSARMRGVYVVASAGNTGIEDANFPSALPQAFSVTALDWMDARAAFASFGLEVDLSAPGVDLLGAYPSETGTARWSGTSFSAALVTGAMALLRELRPVADPTELFQQLVDTAAPVLEPDPQVALMLGAGRLDLDAATLP